MAYRDKDKSRAYQRAWYHANKEKRRETRRRNRARITAWWKAYRATKSCERCGENHPACITFHHRDRKQKEINLSIAVLKEWGIERLESELLKCSVLCANCHSILHFEERVAKWGLREFPKRVRRKSIYVVDT